MFTLLGYMVMFFVEKIMFNAHAIMHSVLDDGLGHGHSHGHGHGVQAEQCTIDHSHTAASDMTHTHMPVLEAAPLEGAPVDAPAAVILGSVEDMAAPTNSPTAASVVHLPSASVEKKAPLSSKSAIILLFAMSLHSLFETMALGTIITRTWQYLFALHSLYTCHVGIATDHSSAFLMAASIGLHQPAESLALLVAFLKTNMPTASIMKWLGIFSLVGPLG